MSRSLKRKRDQPNIIWIMRGIPGTGKTTTALRLKRLYEKYGHKVYYFNRDNTRLLYCAKHNMEYDKSFSDATTNTIVRDKYYEEIERIVRLTRPARKVIIIDSTNTKIADLRKLFYVLDLTKDKDYLYLNNPRKVYVVTKRKIHGNQHNVPENIIKKFEEELKESDEYLKKQIYKK